MKKWLLCSLAILLVSCTSLKPKEDTGYTKQDVKNWDKTIIKEIKETALIRDWYGAENPIYYIRKTGIMKQQEFLFFKELTTKEITTEDIDKFTSYVDKYQRKIKRKFKLRDENIKNPKELIRKMLEESIALRIDNPSKHILEEVLTRREVTKLKNWDKKANLDKKDIKKFRKLLNKIIKRSEFFDVVSWQNKEMSPRMEELLAIASKKKISKLERNNLNAKALSIAYEDNFSELEKWK